MFKLVIQDDEGKTTVVPLIRDEITIGRKEGNTIRLTERNVSRRHARILRNNGEVQIEDLGSYNGIRVNNARIAERVSLRVSDQVQIGDYKLYLKAEGVEQVDDARTVPIERITENGMPTEVMNAVSAPTAPMQAPPLVVTSRASQMGVADTDPAGRAVPVASSHGRLVVVSSNFAGREFELTRPQMIVGRTDENDLVINHRSISRNHAKVTRDGETARYTISDLQSSNGVRVNGQDYGKVELRRGDTVDLGHVRLRFVEPGEDFVFARDAVITDVPEASSRKGLFVVLAIAVIVLGGVAIYMLKGSKEEARSQPTAGPATGSSTTQIVAPPENPPNTGSSTATAEVPAFDAAPVAPPEGSNTANPPAGAGIQECQQLATTMNWGAAISCIDNAASQDPDARKLRQQYANELHNEMFTGKIEDAVKHQDLAAARAKFADIPAESVYHPLAQKLIDGLEGDLVARFRDEALAMKHSGKCDGYDKLLSDARDKGGAKAEKAVAAVKCEKVAVVEKDCSTRLVDNSRACVKQFCAGNPGDPKCTTGAATPPPPANCDPDAAKQKGLDAVNMGQHAAGLAQFEASLRCKSDAYVVQLAFMASCKSQNSTKAKYFFAKLSPMMQQKLAQMCIREQVPYQ